MLYVNICTRGPQSLSSLRARKDNDPALDESPSQCLCPPALIIRGVDLVSEELCRKTPVSVGASNSSRVVSDGERSLVGVELDELFVGRVMRVPS